MRQLTLLLMTVSLLVGGVPQKISYQGYITHADGSLVSDGSYDVKFRLFQANEGGDALWEESQSLTIGSGLISATLGNSIALNFSESMHFLEIEINGEVLTPRQELTTVFFAFHAESAVNAATANLATKATTADTALYSKASAAVSMGNLSDVDLTNIADGKILKYDGTNTKFVVSDDATTTSVISMSDADADTKIQLEESSDEDKIRFDTGGSERMIIDNSGNLGISTTSPSNKLELGSGDVAIVDNGHRMGKIRLWQETSNLDSAVSHAIGTEDFHNTYGAGPSYANSIGHKFYRGGGELIARFGFGGSGTPSDRLYSYFSGNVGIGTVSPEAKLHIEDSSGEAFRIISTKVGNSHIGWLSKDNYFSYGSTGKTFFRTYDGSSYSNKVVIDSVGSVGIGTTSPGSELDVKGTLRLSGSTSGYVGLKGAASAGSTTFTLPSADGTSGQVLSTNGSGTLSWSSVSGGSLANATTTIGTGSADAKLASNGNYDLVLQTGNSTTGTITISDGANGNIAITPNGTGEVDISKVDIDGGAIDGTAIGANSASTGAFSTLSATGTVTVGAGANEFTISESSDDITLKNTISDKDVIFNVNDGGTATEVMRLDGSEGSVLVVSAQKVQFRDTGLMINSSADGQLDIDADTEVEITTTTVDLNGALDVSGTSTLAGAVTANAGVVVDNITIDGTEIDLSSGDLTLDVAGDIYLNADGGNILFQDGSADLMEIDANSRISLSNNDSGTSNTIFGKSAGASLDAGSNYNVFIGDAVSDATMDDATLNVGLGSSALSALTTGDKNVATGYKSLFSNTTGTYNTSIGAYALQLNTTGEKNIAIGGGALDVSDEEDHNLAIGYDALGGAIDGGEYNVAIGNYSLDANTSGYKNIAVGYDALTANTEGNRNTAVGHGSLIANTTGEYNNAFGLATLYSNTTGGSNIAIGNGALLNNTTASYNTAVGFQSLRDANRTADANAYNTAIGYQAGNTGTNDITTGDKNMLVGASTAASKAAATNQIVIGYGASGTGDNYAVIGNSDITRLYAASDGAGVLYANGTIQSSDRRIKRNIEDVSYGLNYIMSLRPVTYYKKHPRDYPQELKDKFYPDGKVREVSAEDYDKRQIGFIAQEVKEVNEKIGAENNIVSIDEDGFHRMDYQKLVVPLIKAVQELSAKVDRLESLIEANSAEVSVSQ